MGERPHSIVYRSPWLAQPEEKELCLTTQMDLEVPCGGIALCRKVIDAKFGTTTVNKELGNFSQQT